MPNTYACGRSPYTGHLPTCPTYDTLDGSDCTCWDACPDGCPCAADMLTMEALS